MQRFQHTQRKPFDIREYLTKKILIFVIIFIYINGLTCGLNCTGDPCMYGICLEDENSSYSCFCIDGYTGINCEINWDDCWSDPCFNGGTCNDAVAAYNCSCVEGFVGTNCEQKYSECSNQPCLNNGTCVDYDGFTCQCPDGYSGEYCEIDASVCNDTICKNSGECVEGPGFSFYCRCPEGWTGHLCEEDIDECIGSPCKNGGLCINVPASYTCACLFGYTGKDCDKTIVPCDENPCENGAVCLFEDERPVCYCVPDYHGALCELRYDDCESKFANCANGGTCIDGINSFTCSCPVLYTGPLCDVNLPSSSSSSTVTFPEMSSTLSIKNSTATTITASEISSLPKTTESLLTVTSSTPQTSTFLSGTSRSHPGEYATTDVTFSASDGSGISSQSSITTTEIPVFYTEISSAYSTVTSMKTTHEIFVSSEPRSFPTIQYEVSPTSLSTKSEEESISERSTVPFKQGDTSDATYTVVDHRSTTKDQWEEITTKETVDENVETTSSMTIGDSLHGETSSSISQHISTPRYYSTKTSSFEKSTTELPVREYTESSVSATFETTSSNITDSGRNRTLSTTVITTETSKMTPPFFPDKWFTGTSSKTITELKSTTPSMLSSETTFGFATSKLSTIQTVGYSISEEEITTRDQVLRSTESTECQGDLCSTKIPEPPTRSSAECNCTQRGEDCRSGGDVTRAAFTGKSYARQQVDLNVFDGNNATLRIAVRLKTRFKSGIILHVYFDDKKYALVYLELSSLKFQFSCGLETMLLGEIDSPIDSGYEVDIDVRFQYFIKDKLNKCSARLLVNGTTAVSGEQILPLGGILPRHANLHLGGIPVAFSQYFSHVTMGFVGCMDNLKINDLTRHFIYDSVETFQIEECVSFLCLSNPCQNFGACEEVNATIRCRCIAGYTGSYCERSACDENPCALGATCISSPGTGFVCVCPLGAHGLLCEEDTIIVRPSFSVLVPGFSSYIAYGISTPIKDTMELRMKVIPRTFEQISLIAYMGQGGSRRDLSDHLSITYVRGYIMLTWDLGAGVRRIFTTVPLNAVAMSSTVSKSYKPHTIRVGRRGRDAWLAVDGIGNVTGRIMGSMTRLDVSPILYIGGHKSRNFDALPHDLPLHTGFSGCIFDIELRTDNAILPITSSSPATGRGIGECHRSECIRHSCKNGAVCLSHGATYSCVCTKEWMGSDCSTPVELQPPSITRPLCQTTT